MTINSSSTKSKCSGTFHWFLLKLTQMVFCLCDISYPTGEWIPSSGNRHLHPTAHSIRHSFLWTPTEVAVSQEQAKTHHLQPSKSASYFFSFKVGRKLHFQLYVFPPSSRSLITKVTWAPSYGIMGVCIRMSVSLVQRRKWRKLPHATWPCELDFQRMLCVNDLNKRWQVYLVCTFKDVDFTDHVDQCVFVYFQRHVP